MLAELDECGGGGAIAAQSPGGRRIAERFVNSCPSTINKPIHPTAISRRLLLAPRRQRTSRAQHPRSPAAPIPPNGTSLPPASTHLHLAQPSILIFHLPHTMSTDAETLDAVRKRLLETGDWDR
jgi:hypothetical protein